MLKCPDPFLLRTVFVNAGNARLSVIQSARCTRKKKNADAWTSTVTDKGTVSRDFLLQVFSWITFPQAPDYNIRIISNFFENSRRYLQVKVHHRCQRWQICQYQRHRREILPPVPLVLLTICHRCQRYRRQICRRCQQRHWKIATGINDTGGKFATGVIDTGGK